MRRLLTTITLGVGLTMGAAFAANATPSAIVIPGAHTTTVTTTTASTQPLASPSVPNATGSNSRRHGGGGSSGGGSGSGSGYRSSRNAAQSSTAGTWQKDAKGWWLSYGAGNYAKNTWVFKDDKWYYFDVEGYMLTSWRHINNNW